MNNPQDIVVQQLKHHIRELHDRIDQLSLKKKEAELIVKQYAHELDELNAQHRSACQKMLDMESTHCNMWENIGDGG